jgi:hypothetical protein
MTTAPTLPAHGPDRLVAPCDGVGVLVVVTAAGRYSYPACPGCDHCSTTARVQRLAATPSTPATRAAAFARLPVVHDVRF